MVTKISKLIFIICVTVSCLYIIYRYSTISDSLSFILRQNGKQNIFFKSDNTEGWISSSLYNELNSYITTRNISYIKKSFIITNGTIKYLPLDNDYISFIKEDKDRIYPYSTYKCSNITKTSYKEGNEYCILTHIYYESSTNKYYFYQNSSEIKNDKRIRDRFIATYGNFKLNIINNDKMIKSLSYSSILSKPNLVVHPPDMNYAHGFLETCGPRFWVISECQSHSSYIDPTKIQIYITSDILNSNPSNWQNYERQSDGTYLPKRRWERIIQSMFSIYPLLTYESFNETTVLFEYMLLTSMQRGRTSVWGHHYSDRPFQSYPFPTINYRRAYLDYSEWILNNFNLKSKFQLTKIQEEIQKNNITEHIPICNDSCQIKQENNSSLNEFTGEWIVVLNRKGARRREITNADELITALLKVFPDHSNPYLRVWPKQLNFDDNLYETARMARSIRLLIGVHGAGLSNTLFMRPGAILYEINPYGCRHLSFNFHRWADVFNLQHALWIPSQGENQRKDENCYRESSITLNVKEIIDEIKNMLENKIQYRNGYIKRALNIITDTTLPEYPSFGFENIL